MCVRACAYVCVVIIFASSQPAAMLTMRTVIPAFWQVRTASGTSLRTGSLMPTMARQVSPLSTCGRRVEGGRQVG